MEAPRCCSALPTQASQPSIGWLLLLLLALLHPPHSPLLAWLARCVIGSFTPGRGQTTNVETLHPPHLSLNEGGRWLWSDETRRGGRGGGDGSRTHTSIASHRASAAVRGVCVCGVAVAFA